MCRQQFLIVCCYFVRPRAVGCRRENNNNKKENSKKCAAHYNNNIMYCTALHYCTVLCIVEALCVKTEEYNNNKNKNNKKRDKFERVGRMAANALLKEGRKALSSAHNPLVNARDGHSIPAAAQRLCAILLLCSSLGKRLIADTIQTPTDNNSRGTALYRTALLYSASVGCSKNEAHHHHHHKKRG